MEAWRALPLLCLLRFWFWSAPTCMSCADMPKVEKCGFSMSACTTDEGKTPSYRRQPADAPAKRPAAQIFKIFKGQPGLITCVLLHTIPWFIVFWLKLYRPLSTPELCRASWLTC